MKLSGDLFLEPLVGYLCGSDVHILFEKLRYGHWSALDEGVIQLVSGMCDGSG